MGNICRCENQENFQETQSVNNLNKINKKLLQLNKKSDDDSTINSATKIKIIDNPYASKELPKFNSHSFLEKIILKNKVNKIIKIYRNYHKKKK